MIAPGHVAINDLQTLKGNKYPDLGWRVDEKRGTTALMQAVIDGEVDYTIADSVAISLFQRVHPELAVALDISDEQPVTWFSARSEDNSLSAAMLDFFNNMNEDGTTARLEEKYLGHGNDFDYVDTRTFLRAVDNILPDLQPMFENMRARSTGACWRPFPAGVTLGSAGHFAHRGTRHDDADPQYRAEHGINRSYRCGAEP